MLLSIDEILTGIDQLKTKEERIATLKKYKHDAIEAILRGAFDPDIKWALPEGPVPFRASGAIDQQGMLYSEYKRFYIFIEGSCPNLRQARRELLFVQFLESLHPGDAALMTHVKDKHLPYPNITPELVEEAFPNLLSRLPGPPKVPEGPLPWVGETEQLVKVKKPLSAKQLAGLERARQKRKANIAARKEKSK